MANMIPISTVTVGSGGAATIAFTGIPQIYTDLCVKLSIRTARAVIYDFIYINPNGSTANATTRILQGDGTSASSESTSRLRFISQGNTATSNSFGTAEIYIPNYTSSNNKSFSMETVTENNDTPALRELNAGLWSDTSPINSLSFVSYSSSNFNQYTTATLYGIRKY